MKEQEQSQGESPKGTQVEPGSSQTMPAIWEAGLPLYSPSEPDTKPQVSAAEVLGGSETDVFLLLVLAAQAAMSVQETYVVMMAAYPCAPWFLSEGFDFLASRW